VELDELSESSDGLTTLLVVMLDASVVLLEATAGWCEWCAAACKCASA
jgi:hypothetical protein